MLVCSSDVSMLTVLASTVPDIELEGAHEAYFGSLNVPSSYKGSCVACDFVCEAVKCVDEGQCAALRQKHAERADMMLRIEDLPLPERPISKICRVC